MLKPREEGLAGAERNGIDDHLDGVDEAGSGKLSHDAVAAEDRHVGARLGLHPTDRSFKVVLDRRIVQSADCSVRENTTFGDAFMCAATSASPSWPLVSAAGRHHVIACDRTARRRRLPHYLQRTAAIQHRRPLVCKAHVTARVAEIAIKADLHERTELT